MSRTWWDLSSRKRRARSRLPGADLAAHLARSGLIDEYRLYIHPVVLGGGKPYFQSGLSLTLKPLGKESLTQGVTLLRYAPAG
ncbi:dihydrofolate reductase family protein [Mesorhizobium ventifaucium]|nr:dihydrofolate reductase family protein [Mesorhizobium ventifaucium]